MTRENFQRSRESNKKKNVRDGLMCVGPRWLAACVNAVAAEGGRNRRRRRKGKKKKKEKKNEKIPAAISGLMVEVKN